MVSVMSSFLSPAFIPEDLEPVLVIAAESAEVGQHLVHEFNVTRGPSVADLLPTFGDHEVPGPQEAWKKFNCLKVGHKYGKWHSLRFG
jgi:hypothetical protein